MFLYRFYEDEARRGDNEKVLNFKKSMIELDIKNMIKLLS